MEAEKYLAQAKHNFQFLKELDANQPDNFFDWKITVCFYTALHLMKAFLKDKYGITTKSHSDILTEIKNGTKVSQQCWKSYRNLRQSCDASRYNGFEDDEFFIEQNREEYQRCCERLTYITKYLKGKKGIDLGDE